MDLRTIYDTELRSADLVLASGQMDTDTGLQTAVFLSLFTDARAQDDDELPGGSTDRRGWFGDSFADTAGDRFGSRLWLLYREKQTDQVLERARGYARESLQWLIDDGVASSVDVAASWLRAGVLLLEVAILRAEGGPVQFRFEYFWSPSNGV